MSHRKLLTQWFFYYWTVAERIVVTNVNMVVFKIMNTVSVMFRHGIEPLGSMKGREFLE
jgi:hypothetical protein